MGRIDDEIEALASGIAEKKSAFAVDKLTVLMKTINDGVEELLDNQSRTEYFDKGLGKQIVDAVEKAITGFTKLPPQKAPVVNVSSPQVNVDLKPLQSIANDITQQNKNLISALEKNNSSDASLYGLMASMIAKQNTIIESMVSLLNKPEEKEVGKERPILDKLVITRNTYGHMVATPEYKKINK